MMEKQDAIIAQNPAPVFSFPPLAASVHDGNWSEREDESD
jgi:hypothetical protein